ncbi:variant erythrocyte surface antigen-1 family protein [Babesia divergens]|uniref:Variant erythrocyte surface antigen-1 family protein n=1 Tax=Babesia divergens TaxID=32595 RepID=A0AAD9G5F4_BABDI|nr:variant erythrocyte surface antigen-1 family protein [Babesia divergens]
MLLWLYGLRFQKHFSDIVENCKSLCLPFGNSFHPDAFCYYIHASCFLLPVAIISLIEDSLSITSLHSEFSKFFYPSDPSDLLEKFCEYARKIFVALAFLYYQCERVPGQGGWQFCWYGKSCSVSSTSGSSSSSDCKCQYKNEYLCTNSGSNKDVHKKHCGQDKCLGFGSGSTSGCSESTHNKADAKSQSNGQPCSSPCPHPLQRFLVATSNSQSQDYPFGLSRIVPMGFSKENLPSPGRKGQDLYHDIYGFCKDGFYPLTRLVQFILCISQRPPDTLGELYAFFKKFAAALNSKPELSSKFVQWIEGEPGSYPGKALKDAVQNLYGSHSGSSHSPANLFSLSDCRAPKSSKATCGPYLHALTDKASGVFTPELCSMYLSWICYRAEKFYSEFKRFHKEAQEKFSCCLKSSGSSCPKIVECPCALPFIYSQGFTFMSPSGLNCVDNEGKSKHKGGQGHSEGNDKCTQKSCSDFVAQLKLVAEGDPFKKLLEEIPKLIWSIREPFFLFVLAFWAFVISYFLYVQLYKLDVLELNSHDHPAWSFKILPSTLFSDASSRLKDLSYFTL